MDLGAYVKVALFLIQNAALLALGTIGYCQFRPWLQKRLSRGLELLVFGLVLGLLGVVIMLVPITATPGIQLDLRSAVIAVSTLFGGFAAGTVTLAVVAFGRTALGGAGVVAGIIGMLITFALSSGVHAILRRLASPVRPRHLVWLGLAIGVGTYAIYELRAAFPAPDSALPVLREIMPVWLVLMPATIVFLGCIVIHFERSWALANTLNERESDLRAILDNAPMAIFLKDRMGRYRLVNRCYEEWYGLARDKVYGRTDDELFPPHNARIHRTSDIEVIEKGRVTQVERGPSNPLPTIEYMLTTKFPVRDAAGQIIGIAGFIVDITARRQAEEAQHRFEERFRALIEYSNELVAVVQPDGLVTYRAPSLTEGLGYAAKGVPPGNVHDLVHPDDAAAFSAEFNAVAGEAGRRGTGRSRFKHFDGTWRHIAWGARNATNIPSVGGIIINFFDITEMQTLEEKLLQAQKMEAVGRLAGGIAHDFNNILGAIVGFAGFLVQDLPRDTPQHGFADRIVTACERAKELVQQILAFSRHSEVKREPHDVTRLVRETEDLIRASLPSSTQLNVTCNERDLVVDVNPAQMSQILLNLTLNANDSLEGEPGQVSLDVCAIRPGADDYALFQSADTQRGMAVVKHDELLLAGSLHTHRPYVRIEVSDTGAGMAPDVLKRIFDPFFSTKQRGQGTGLGLSVVHGIVAAYDGACMVTSRPGKGTVFSIYLPLEVAKTAVILRPTNNTDVTGHERVLIVDDDADLRDVLTVGLERLGYEVVAIGDPQEALDAVTEDPAAWDIVISDEVMPVMKGISLLRRLKAIRPTLGFILCTGFGGSVTEEVAWNAGVDEFFIKPVSVHELAAAIRRICDTKPHASRRAGS